MHDRGKLPEPPVRLRMHAVALALAVALLSTEAASQVILTDSLDGSTSGAQNGGQFVTGGWQAPGQITWDLGQPVTEGGMSIHLTNWNPDATSPQHHFDKQHILNMYESSHGSPHASDGDIPKTGFFNVRTGASYDNLFKFLSSTAGFDPPPFGRFETRNARDPGFVNPAQTYELSVEWTFAGDITAKLDGVALVTHSHGRTFPLRHVFVGTDNAPGGTYGPQHDVIYSNLEVWGTSNLPDAGTGGSGGSGGTGGSSGSGGAGGSASTFDVVADTWSEPAAPDATHGSDPDLRVGGDGRTTYLRFVVSGVGTVVNARVLVEAMNGGGGGDIREVEDDSWDETALCHSNRPIPSSDVLASLGVVDIGSSYSFDVTEAVTGDGVYSFAITSDVEDGSGYDSKESGGVPPQLVVTWEPNGAAGAGGAVPEGGSSGTGGGQAGGSGGTSGTEAGTGGSTSDAASIPTAPGGSASDGEGCGCSVPSGRGARAWIGLVGLCAVMLLRGGRARSGSILPKCRPS